MTAITARAPTRLDFGGGWTDVPPYSLEEGGFVCNLAIARYASVRVDAVDPNAAQHPFADAGDGALAAAVLRRYGSPKTIVRPSNDFPVKAGLGGSSAAGVAMITAIAAHMSGLPAPSHNDSVVAGTFDRSALAEASRSVEVDELGVAGGRQDHYAAAYGGALALSFGEATSVRRIPIAVETRRALAERLVVVYTGESRISGETITAVLDAYARRESRVLDALSRMKGLARDMAEALAGGDIDTLGALVGTHWTFQRALHPAIPTARIDAIIDRGLAAGALGAKALGASGGGCVLLVAAPGKGRAVREAVAPLGDLVEIAIDDRGAHWWAGDARDQTSSPNHHS